MTHPIRTELHVKHLYLKSWWRRLLNRAFPVRPVRTVKVNAPFRSDPNQPDANLQVADLPRFGLSFHLNERDASIDTIKTDERLSAKVVGYDLTLTVSRTAARAWR